MTTDLCTDDVVVHVTSPQIITAESVSAAGVGVVPASRGAGAGAGGAELGRHLLLAARAGDTQAVLDLMAKGAPFTTDWLGTSPLHLAAANAHVETCAVLLRAGVSRDARTKVERTPLHLAAHAGHARVVRLLLEHGANVDCRDMLRMTPLHWAAARGHEAVARELLRRGADVRARCKFRKTPRCLALRACAQRLVRLLDEHERAADTQHLPAHTQHGLRPAPRAPARRARARRRHAAPTRPHAARSVHTHIHTHARRKFRKTPRCLALQACAQRLVRLLDEHERAADTQHLPAHTQHDSLKDETSELKEFETVQRIQEINPTKVKQQQQEKTIRIEAKSEGRNGGAEALLRRHGITLLPTDDGSTVLSALQSGRTVVLSDAGKLMLKESGALNTSVNSAPKSSTSGANVTSIGIVSNTGGISNARVSTSVGAGSTGGTSAAVVGAGGTVSVGGVGGSGGVVLTAKAVKSLPRAGPKVFTLNGLTSLANLSTTPIRRVINPRDLQQVKIVKLPPDATIISPSKVLPLKAKKKISQRTPVKIVMNKSNFEKLIANANKATVTSAASEVSSSGLVGQGVSGGSGEVMLGESVGDEELGEVGEEGGGVCTRCRACACGGALRLEAAKRAVRRLATELRAVRTAHTQ
ncbi:unnamed protein product [Parnassius apollo]|uniref:(apollo) hypothetical protein n=1 Tax=Parnassius apollo TaxID=110799 RepID=A0A8S3Y6H4_PARAO|nr:unnamed protein product [Parnassius apollo]